MARNYSPNRSRRTFLQLVGATSALAGYSTVAGADEHDDEMDDDEAVDPFADVPTAGEFPAGETVGLQLVADGLAAPTDFQAIEVDGQVHHFVVTQTGQIYRLPDEADDPEDTGEETNETDDTDESDATDEMEAEDDEQPVANDEADGPDEGVVEFVLDGVTAGWVGSQPAAIEGVENPTLELVAGESYAITWINEDGEPHNVAILDADDNILERTEIISGVGVEQTLEFEATEEMDRYICEVHPTTMDGSISVEPPEEPPEEPEEPEEPAEPEEPEEPAEPEEPEEPTVEPAEPADMELFLDLEDRIVSLGIGELGNYDERGLYSLAFHPDFEDNRKFYVRYSAPGDLGRGHDHVDVLAEFEADEDYHSADPDTERRIMEVGQPQDNHNGGQLAFGPDGYLYTSIGDGGNVHDIGIGHVQDWYDGNEGGNSQDTSQNLLGGIHRIDVDPESEDEAEGPFVGAYDIPEDNPLADSDEFLGEYYAWGFRNPWGMSIDDEGTMFVADAGQHAIESVYTVEAGGNYGWNVKEGSFCFSPATPLDPPAECPDYVDDDDVPAPRGGEALREPIAEYSHQRITEAFIDSSVVVGGHRYTGEAIPELQGNFVFGNWSSLGVESADGEVLVAIDPGEDEVMDEDEMDEEPVEVEQWELEELQFAQADDESINRYVYSVERDEEGELYLLTNTDFRPFPATGEIYKIVPENEAEPVPAPEDPAVVETPDEEPDEEPEEPDEEPEEPDEEPEDTDEEPEEPDEEPDDPNGEPDEPNGEPDDPNGEPDDPNGEPDDPNGEPDEPNGEPDEND